MQTVNITAYKFISFDVAELTDLRDHLDSLGQSLNLRGTILLSREGINLSLAGKRQEIDDLKQTIAGDARLTDLVYKESFSDFVPFDRLLVKLRAEIITLRAPGIDPESDAAPSISAETLKKWLDEGRDIGLLDARNAYEVQLGTFRGADDLDMESFGDLPYRIEALDRLDRSKPVVTFCTGGIRCEKAAPFLYTQGFSTVYQLRGGILQYFKTCGDAHYDGECFVYDQRVALTPRLEPSGATLCQVCGAPVTAVERKAATETPGQQCPSCGDD